MTINNPAKFMEGIWDWKILNGCFDPTRITPTDIDGCVERNGHILVIEAKSPGVEIPTGQEIMFKNMTKTGKISVMVVWGETNKPEEMKLFSPFGEEEKKKVDISGFRERVTSWFKWADKQSN